jgi:hypothetical protein
MRTGMGDHRVPIYLQEPTAYGTRGDDDTTAAHFRDAAVAAKAAGAAAWTFHQRAGFNLQSQSFASRLGDEVGLANAMQAIRAAIDATAWGADATDETDFYHLPPIQPRMASSSSPTKMSDRTSNEQERDGHVCVRARCGCGVCRA